MSSALIHWTVLALAALLAVVGLVLTTFAFFRDRSRGRPRCPKCWYDMSGVTGLRCPECGRDARRPKRLLKTRRRWRRAALGCVLIVIAAAAFCGQRIYEKGWVKGLPNAGYAAALPWLESNEGMKELQSRINDGELRQWEYRLLVRQCCSALSRADTSPRKLELIELLRSTARNGRDFMFSKPYASWAALPERDGSRAVKALAALVEDPDPDVRASAIMAIYPFASAMRPAIPAILGHINDTGYTKVAGTSTMTVSSAAEMVIAESERCAPSVLSLSFDFPREVTRPILGHLSSSAKSPLERLRGCGTDIPRAVPILLECLRSNDANMRLLAVWAVGAAAFDDADAQEQVLRLSNDESWAVRNLVVGLAARCPQTDRTVEIIRNALDNKPAFTRPAGLVAVAALGGRGSRFRDEVRRVLEDRGAEIDWPQAAVTWVEIGGDPRFACDVLMRLVRNTQMYHKKDVLRGLVKVGMSSPEVLADLAPLLEAGPIDNRAFGERAAAAYTYARLGGSARLATQTLLDDGWMSKPYLCALARSGQLDIPTLLEWLENAQWLRFSGSQVGYTARQFAALVLGECGKPGEVALLKLDELKGDRDPGVASAAEEAIKRIEWERDHPKQAARLRERYSKQDDPFSK